MNTDRIRCTDALEKLPLFVGGDLDPQLQASVRSHLEGCPACAARAGSAGRGRRELLTALQERGHEATRPDLWDGIRSALLAEGRIQDAGLQVDGVRPVGTRTRARAHARRAGRRWSARLLAPLAAAAALLLVVQAGFFSTAGEGAAGDPGRLAPQPGPLVQVEGSGVPSGIVPVSLVESEARPERGFLQRVPADEALRSESAVKPFRRPVERRAAGDPSISLTGYH